VAGLDGQAFTPGFAGPTIRRANDTSTIKAITPHAFSETFATLMSEAGVPIQTVQRVMRHKSFTTTMGYLEKNLEVAVHTQVRIGEIACQASMEQTRMTVHAHARMRMNLFEAIRASLGKGERLWLRGSVSPPDNRDPGDHQPPKQNID